MEKSINLVNLNKTSFRIGIMQTCNKLKVVDKVYLDTFNAFYEIKQFSDPYTPTLSYNFYTLQNLKSPNSILTKNLYMIGFKTVLPRYNTFEYIDESD